MRKLLAIIIIIFLFITSGCTTDNTEEATAEGTQMVTEKSTVTSKPTSTPTQKPTPEATATPAPTETPIPTPSPRPTPIPELNLPDNFFGDGGVSYFGSNHKIAQDDEGNVFYVDRSAIKKIDAKTGETTVLLSPDKVEGGNISGVRFLSGKLYAEIDTGYFENPIKIYDIEAGKTLEKEVTAYTYFFNNIIMHQKEEVLVNYEFIDINTNEFVEIQNLSNEFYNKNISAEYFSEEYIIFLNNKYRAWNEDDIENRLIYFVDAKTYEIAGVLKTTDIADGYFDIVHCEGNDIYILRYDEKLGKQVFSKYSVYNKRLTNIIKFSPGRYVFGYDAEEKNLYFKFNKGYEHSKERVNGNVHEDPEWCMSEDEYETAVEKFMMINIETKDITETNSVSTWEYIKDDYCINLMIPYKVGDYIITLAEDFFESYDPYWFSSKFKIEEEIDYSTWKE